MGDGGGEKQQSASRRGGGDGGRGHGDDDDNGPHVAAGGATTTDDGSDCGESRDHGEAKTTDVVVTDSRSEDDDLGEGNRPVTGAVNALDYLTTTMHERTSASSITSEENI
jgi:hypothetical protein